MDNAKLQYLVSLVLMHRNFRRDLEIDLLVLPRLSKMGKMEKGCIQLKLTQKHLKSTWAFIQTKKHYLCHLQLFRDISWELISLVMSLSNFTSPSDIPKKWMAKVSLLSPMICCGIHATAGRASTSLQVHLCLIH